MFGPGISPASGPVIIAVAILLMAAIAAGLTGGLYLFWRGLCTDSYLRLSIGAVLTVVSFTYFIQFVGG